MLTQKSIAGMWDLVRQRHGIALRAIEVIPEDKLHSHPIPKMRTPAELVVHLYATVFKAICEGALTGEIKEVDEKAIVAGIKTKADLLKFARESYAAATKAVMALTDANLQAQVKAFWGSSFPGWVTLGIVHDELLHHRGQLYAYVRALGAAPPDMWDFANNEPELQPAMQKA